MAVNKLFLITVKLANMESQKGSKYFHFKQVFILEQACI